MEQEGRPLYTAAVPFRNHHPGITPRWKKTPAATSGCIQFHRANQRGKQRSRMETGDHQTWRSAIWRRPPPPRDFSGLKEQNISEQQHPHPSTDDPAADPTPPAGRNVPQVLTPTCTVHFFLYSPIRSLFSLHGAMNSILGLNPYLYYHCPW